jgi:hypothetical protein
MSETPFTIRTICDACKGTGILGAGTVEERKCAPCEGDGTIDYGTVEGADQIADLSTKLDAIKTMLDSPVYGLQKMSSNLDDIMVKLDV